LKDKLTHNAASEALDDYLEVLLPSDEHMACEQINAKAPLSGSKLYHLDAHPSRQQNDQPHDKRHQIERVERLLDDFNRRQKITDETKEQETTTAVKTETPVLVPQSLLQPEILVEDEVENDTEHVEVVETIEVKHEVEETVISTSEETKIWIPEDREMVRENWSDEPFQTLLFEVSGLALALPLVKLGGIHRIDEDITPLFGKPDWFLGLTPGLEGNINVIDTTRWVMPNKYQQAKEAGLNYKFIILLGDTNWGLACSHVQNAITLEPDNIRWRTTAGKRPWLAGMLIDEMCALLDVDTLIYLLEENFPR